MRVEFDNGIALHCSDVTERQFAMLRQIPLHADSSGCTTGEQRLKLKPIDEPLNDADDEANDDWREHTLPELHEEFARQLEVVTTDLATHVQQPSEGEEKLFSFRLPMSHVDAWYGALNQARLMMQERYHFPKIETEANIMAMMNDQVMIGPYLIANFYTEMQSMLLEVMDG